MATAANETSDMLMTWRLARAGESAARVSGTVDTTPSDVAVTDTSAAPTNSMVQPGEAPVPSDLAKRRQMTKNDCNAIAREDARANSPSRAPPEQRLASPPLRPKEQRRQDSTARVTTPFSMFPTHTRRAVLVDSPQDERKAEHASKRITGGRGA